MMKRTTMRRYFGAVALSGALAFVAACSGPSGPGTPTSSAPAAPAGSSSGGVTYSPNPYCASPNVIDPNTGECVPPPATGRFTGGGFQFDAAGVKVTRGFTIHCDNLLANNLEINWAGGNNFHMDKDTLTNVVCQFVAAPNPPAAPVNRITASATGTLNGAPATIDFMLEDNGEPGAGVDRAFLSINGGAALSVGPAYIDGGDIQAHYDQPHK